MDPAQFLAARARELEAVTRRELIAQLDCLDQAQLLPPGTALRVQARVRAVSSLDLLDVAGEIADLADLAVRLLFEADPITAARHLMSECRVANELHKTCHYGGLVPERDLPYPDGLGLD